VRGGGGDKERGRKGERETRGVDLPASITDSPTGVLMLK
jgi:hypothetical protein